MRAVEATGTIDRQGHLLLDHPFDVDISGRVREIVLFADPIQENDPDDTPIEEVKASLKGLFSKLRQGKLDQFLKCGTESMLSDNPLVL